MNKIVCQPVSMLALSVKDPKMELYIFIIFATDWNSKMDDNTGHKYSSIDDPKEIHQHS